MCGNSQTNDPQVGFHRFPSAHMNPERKALRLSVFGKTEDDVTSNSGEPGLFETLIRWERLTITSSTLGKCFASPSKKGVRAERARQRQERKQTESLTSVTIAGFRLVYLFISCCFFQDVGTFMPLQSSHQRTSLESGCVARVLKRKSYTLPYISPDEFLHPYVQLGYCY